MQSIHLATLHVDRLRTRLWKVSDEELRKFGRAARYRVSPTANMGKPPLPNFCAAIGRSSRRVAQEASGVVRAELTYQVTKK